MLDYWILDIWEYKLLHLEIQQLILEHIPILFRTSVVTS